MSRLLPALIASVFPFSSWAACSAADASEKNASNGPCAFERSIGEAQIGPIRIGSSLAEIRTEHSVAPTRLPYSDESGYQVTVCDEEAALTVALDATDAVKTISTTSPSFQTDSGGKVGMSLAQLQTLHPEGVISTGVEEGGWIAFRIDQISGYFGFSLEGIELSCLRDHQTCSTEFYERPAIRYWAR